MNGGHMDNTKQTIENLKEKEKRMDYYKKIKLALYYDLVTKEETNGHSQKSIIQISSVFVMKETIILYTLKKIQMNMFMWLRHPHLIKIKSTRSNKPLC